MGRGSVWMLIAAACATEAAPTLTLQGPAQVRVSASGPVTGGPMAFLSDGSEVEGVEWHAAPTSVAVVRQGVVHAVGPGQADVTGLWEGQEVHWTLVVDAAMVLRFVDAPEGLEVGDEVVLKVEGRSGGRKVEPAALTWSSSDQDVLMVNDGRAIAYQPGVVYVTATDGGSYAQLQLQVR